MCLLLWENIICIRANYAKTEILWKKKTHLFQVKFPQSQGTSVYSDQKFFCLLCTSYILKYLKTDQLGKELEGSVLDIPKNPSMRLLKHLSLSHIYCRLVLSLFKNIFKLETTAGWLYNTCNCKILVKNIIPPGFR